MKGRVPTIEVFHGDTDEIDVLIKDKDTRVAIDLTNITVEMGVSKEKNQALTGTSLFTVVGTNAITVGQVGFSISDINWTLITDNDFDANGKAVLYYDIQTKDTGTSENKRTLGKGKLCVYLDITA